MRLTPAFTAALLVAALIAACGFKTRPRPPEDVRPERIVDLRAQPMSKGIELSWSRPERYQDGSRMRDLGEFVILRALGDSGSFKQMTALPLNDPERFQQVRRLYYLDAATQVDHRYRYEIISRTTDGYESLPSNQVAVTQTPPEALPKPKHVILPTPSAPLGSRREGHAK